MHKHPLISKSKAMLGMLGPVARARVMDLVSEDVERPPSPGQRAAWQQDAELSIEVAQRGVSGTAQILEGIIDGLDLPAHSKVFIVDLLPSRPFAPSLVNPSVNCSQM